MEPKVDWGQRLPEEPSSPSMVHRNRPPRAQSSSPPSKMVSWLPSFSFLYAGSWDFWVLVEVCEVGDPEKVRKMGF